jgi:glycosyltransferase involved in cell wall biosynthesis
VILRSRPPRIVWVLDAPDWIQAARFRELQSRLREFRFEAATAERFARGWRWGRYRRGPVYFATWRLIPFLERSHGLRFTPEDRARFMVSVTSHYNLGGGLKPSEAVPRGTAPSDALAEAVEILVGCAVVTVNSTPLRELLSADLPNLVYAPNGVDADFFAPPDDAAYDPTRIRIGWVGKVKAAKNFETMREAIAQLEREGFSAELIAHSKDIERDRLLDAEGMRRFYHRIDHYLCASWHEGTPNPGLEAAACGVPVVTTRVGNMVDLIRHGENGFFVEPTADSIVETFRSLRSVAPEEYRRLRDAARRSIEDEWTWEQRAENYRTAFASLLERSGAAGATLAR